MTLLERQTFTSPALDPVGMAAGESGVHAGWWEPLAFAVMAAMTTSNPTTATLARLERYLPESTTALQVSRAPRSSATPAPDPALAADRIRDILRYLGLTKTQLKDACKVSRQTLYDWLAGRFEPEAANAERLRSIHHLAIAAERLGTPLTARLVQLPVEDGPSFVQRLGEETPNFARLGEIVVQLSRASEARRNRSALAALERMGGAAAAEATQRQNLDDNLDDLG